LADPLGPSRQLGRHHSFMNLLDLCGCTVPVGLRADGVPAGMTLCAPPFSERRLLAIGRRIAAALPPLPPPPADDALIPVVVAGAHLSGMPLNGELTAAGGRLESALRTSPDYRLFALAGTAPPKPGLQRVGHGGTQIAVEVWWLPARAFRRVADAVRAPLAMGRVMLEDGREVAGFVCADGELRDAVDISTFGGWKAYLAHR
jgi:allophanate hydrolase